jgi:hypothetical protein
VDDLRLAEPAPRAIGRGQVPPERGGLLAAFL